MRPRLTLRADAIAGNVRAWRAFVADREVWAVVKSDAYGLGAVAVARACVDAGAARLAIFDVEEARPLRAAGIRAPIVHVAATAPSDFPAAAHLGVTPTVESAQQARALAEVAQWRLRRIPAHIAIDTGTGWAGIVASRAAEFARAVRDLSGVVWEGAWTHIASQDSMDAQLRAFATAVATLRDEGIAVPVLHVASTGPAVWGRTTGAVRIGIGLYGSTLGVRDAAPKLRTALEVRAPIVAIKQFDAPTPLGYGGIDVAAPGDRIATLRAGYADGVPPAMRGGAVAIDGALGKIVGAIGMNATMVRLPEDVRTRVGAEALLVGDLPGISIDEAAASAGVIPHALVTSLAAGMRPSAPTA